MSTPHFTSREMKAIMKISDCELMHLRTSKQLSFIKKGCSLDVRRTEIFALIDRWREHETTDLVCSAMGFGVSSYYERK